MKLAPNDDKDFELTGVLSPEERGTIAFICQKHFTCLNSQKDRFLHRSYEVDKINLGIVSS